MRAGGPTGRNSAILRTKRGERKRKISLLGIASLLVLCLAQWLVVDQLNVEKKGIPTVTIVTSAFADTIRKLVKDQDVPQISLVVVEHPIAGQNLEGVRKKAGAAFADILKAATRWQPPGKQE